MEKLMIEFYGAEQYIDTCVDIYTLIYTYCPYMQYKWNCYAPGMEF